MKTITKCLEDFLNNIQEDMVLFINEDTFSIEPISAEEYHLEDAEEIQTINGYNIYIFEDL